MDYQPKIFQNDCFYNLLPAFLSAAFLLAAASPALSQIPQLPERQVPVVVPQPPAPPPPPGQRQQCYIFQSLRGPGSGSRWNGTRGPYYYRALVWIGSPSAVNPSNFRNWFYWDNSLPGWWIRNGNWGALPRPTASFTWDPCNRSNDPNCASRRRDMPQTFTYQGATYNLLNAPFAAGGTCGSSNCTCLVSGLISPLMIDLKNMGIQYTSFGEHVMFDFGEGQMPTTWPSNADSAMFLVNDKNDNGKIDGIEEMFGDNTPSINGRKNNNGFEALREFDSNKDNIIDQKDMIWGNLQLWSDANVNAATDPGELKSLSQFQITGIELNYQELLQNQDTHGNMSRQVAAVRIAGGGRKEIYDVWFAPVHPLSVRGAGAGKKVVHRMPKKGSANHSTLYKSWERALLQENFRAAEIPYEGGVIKEMRHSDGRLEKRIATWKHISGDCRLEIVFKPDWSVLDAFSRCT